MNMGVGEHSGQRAQCRCGWNPWWGSSMTETEQSRGVRILFQCLGKAVVTFMCESLPGLIRSLKGSPGQSCRE